MRQLPLCSQDVEAVPPPPYSHSMLGANSFATSSMPRPHPTWRSRRDGPRDRMVSLAAGAAAGWA